MQKVKSPQQARIHSHPQLRARRAPTPSSFTHPFFGILCHSTLHPLNHSLLSSLPLNPTGPALSTTSTLFSHMFYRFKAMVIKLLVFQARAHRFWSSHGKFFLFFFLYPRAGPCMMHDDASRLATTRKVRAGPYQSYQSPDRRPVDTLHSTVGSSLRMIRLNFQLCFRLHPMFFLLIHFSLV